ncbi:hypothetical protein [Anaerococcus vaginalis]|uniref:hypothetical protein n=1 Tax=Anaerococcus vaginalis TaxID=33037 RepID=UPI0022E5BF40|nr:hypothetical protein [Anaerococcus vaginalis]
MNSNKKNYYKNYIITNAILWSLLLLSKFFLDKLCNKLQNTDKIYAMLLIIILIIVLAFKKYMDKKLKSSKIFKKSKLIYEEMMDYSNIVLLLFIFLYIKSLNNIIYIDESYGLIYKICVILPYINFMIIILFFFKSFDLIRKYILCISYKKLLIFGSWIFLAGIISINSWQIISLLFAFISLCINYDNYSSIYKYIYKETLIINSIRKQELKAKFAFMRIILAFLNLFIYILIILTQNSKITLTIYSFFAIDDINKFPNFAKIFFLGVDRLLIILFIYFLFVFLYKDKFKNRLKKLMNSDSFLDFPFSLLFLN